MTLDYLGIASHPDDLEIYVSGLFMGLKKKGYKVGFCDLSKGELGTHGTADLRSEEIGKANAILELDHRETLGLPDGNLRNDEASREQVVQLLRTLKPKAVVTFGGEVVRHPDHLYTGLMVRECCFLSGLEKFPNSDLKPHKPKVLFQFTELVSNQKPDFVVDISEVWERKVAAIRSYASQVFSGEGNESEGRTFIKSRSFWDMFTAKSRWLGSLIGAKYGEGFLCEQALRLSDPLDHFVRH